ncbi:AI-2E family transporter, partial [Streptococcus suis]
VPMKKLEDQFEKISFLKKSKRSLEIVGVLIGFSLIVTGLVVIVLPTLVTTVSELVSVRSTAIPTSVNALTNFLESNGLLSGQIGDQIASF